MLFFIVAYLGPGSGLASVIYRLVRTRDLVTVARLDSARAGVRLEGAQRAALVAEEGRAEALGQAREALSQTGQALEIARTIEQVGQQVQGLTDYLVARIDGEAPQRGTGRHELPGGTGPQAITSGRAPEGCPS